eukprot:3573008-Pyramimonas_sp.AAC.1
MEKVCVFIHENFRCGVLCFARSAGFVLCFHVRARACCGPGQGGRPATMRPPGALASGTCAATLKPSR